MLISLPAAFSNPVITSALVSAGVTLIIFILKGTLKPFWEKHFHKYKLKSEHEYEQRKHIKSALSKYKAPLLDAAESLNHRLWNFSSNCKHGWLIIDPRKTKQEQYYLYSFCYRFLSFFALCRKIEKELVYLDSTLSEKNDLYFVKYLKLMKNIFCDASIFKDLDYDVEHAVDHFFKDDMLSIVDSLITENGVISFSEFDKLGTEKYQSVINYFSSISKERNCNKWYVLHAFHFVLMAFLSKYGYDYQVTSKKKLNTLFNATPKNIITNNLLKIISDMRLDDCKKMKISIKILTSTHNYTEQPNKIVSP